MTQKENLAGEIKNDQILADDTGKDYTFNIANVKGVLFTDIDKSITTGELFYFSNGVIGKAFDAHDAHGFALLKQSGILPCALSGNNDLVNVRRMSFLHVPFFHAPDKLHTATVILNKIGWNGFTAGFGDDIPDIPLLRAVDLAGCPRNAHRDLPFKLQTLEKRVLHISQYDGGKGAFRDFVEIVLSRIT